VFLLLRGRASSHFAPNSGGGRKGPYRLISLLEVGTSKIIKNLMFLRTWGESNLKGKNRSYRWGGGRPGEKRRGGSEETHWEKL